MLLLSRNLAPRFAVVEPSSVVTEIFDVLDGSGSIGNTGEGDAKGATEEEIAVISGGLGGGLEL
jgi:hypothetical protein